MKTTAGIDGYGGNDFEKKDDFKTTVENITRNAKK